MVQVAGAARKVSGGCGVVTAGTRSRPHFSNVPQ